jgi:hypothetical protein
MVLLESEYMGLLWMQHSTAQEVLSVFLCVVCTGGNNGGQLAHIAVVVARVQTVCRLSG